MPFKVEKRGERWACLNPETGKVYGEHDTESGAQAQMRALYMHAPPEKERKDGLVTVRRYDVLERLDGPKLLPNGWLRADAFVARTGVQQYRRADGSIQRELRLPDEVFHPDAMASLSMLPITDEHPPELLDAANTSKYARGHVGEKIEPVDNRLVKAPVLVTDAALANRALSGEQAELSVGYLCALDSTPGEWNGQPYDVIQRGIRGNHIALTRAARGGPELRMKLDAADAVALPLDADPDRAIRGIEKRDDDLPGGRRPENAQMVTVKIDGIAVEVKDDQAAQLIERALASRDQALTQAKADAKAALDAATGKATETEKTLKGEAEKEKARADAAEKALDTEKKARKDAEDPAKLRSAIKARVALETRAAPHLPEDFKMDGATDLDVKRAVLSVLAPELDLKGKTDGYVEHRFDFEMERAPAPETKERPTVDAQDEKGERRGRETRVDAEASRKKMLEHNRKAWEPAEAD